MLRGSWGAILSLSLLASAADGREITVKLTPTDLAKVPFVVPVVAPAAYCAAVGDTAGLVAVGHKVDKQAQLSLSRLDAQGKAADEPIVVQLAKPGTLAPRDPSPLP